MSRDTLFLLKEDFLDGPGAPYFCPDCALVTGLLTYFPKLRHGLDIQYVDFAKPRAAIVALLGESHQGCPVLILSQTPSSEAAAWVTGQSNGKSFVAGATAIAKYWAAVNGVSRPH
jgi:hypothetical protein